MDLFTKVALKGKAQKEVIDYQRHMCYFEQQVQGTISLSTLHAKPSRSFHKRYANCSKFNDENITLSEALQFPNL